MGAIVREGPVNRSFQMDPQREWVHLGTHISHVPDVEYPWNPCDVREIRESFDPGFVPVFRRMAYRSQAGAIVVFKHHGNAWYDALSPDSDHLIATAEFPSTGYGSDWGFRYGHCNRVFWYELATDRRPKWCQRNGLPGPMVPWGQWIIRMAEETQRASRNAARKFLELQEEEESERMKVANFEKSEASYREKSEGPLQKKLLESMGVDDYRAMAAPLSHRSTERRPFVHLKQGN
jgi:hypothetical protein